MTRFKSILLSFSYLVSRTLLLPLGVLMDMCSVSFDEQHYYVEAEVELLHS